jgi:anti-sigma regulatory factor (Ser/Thr protein kinase)
VLYSLYSLCRLCRWPVDINRVIAGRRTLTTNQVYLMQVYRRTYEGQLEQLAAIHGFVDEVTAVLGLSEGDAFACRLAVDEAAANAFEHAYSGRPGKLEVVIRYGADSIGLEVRNWGAPFDPEAVEEPSINSPLEERRVGGMGIFLMKKYMDEVSFGFDPQEGNTITMRRRFAMSPKPGVRGPQSG